MKNTLFLIVCFAPLVAWSQNVQVDVQRYSPQQLIEDILIGSDCISDVSVTNVVGGNFNGTDQSYGYFEASGSNFPFVDGLVLTTGRSQNVDGPNDSLSDDDAPGWVGDQDLENILNESQTINATIIEFDFQSQYASQISFRYLFASEEYQEGNSNTCQYSDLFGFLIRRTDEQVYRNIALLPDNRTPIKVTTVHPGIPGGCNPINENYFESWNGTNAPINFNGQTKVLRAVADITPNITYHVKLVIADHINYRYDSAVFLEAGSFQLSTDLGPNRLLTNNNALCENETITISSSVSGSGSYIWFKDGMELIGETNPTLDINDAGVYSLELDNGVNCTFYGEVVIEYSPNPSVSNSSLIYCDIDLNGFTTYNLFDASNAITSGNNDLNVVDFYETNLDANQDTDAIPNPTTYDNTSVLQTVYARVENRNGCFSIAEVILDISYNQVTLENYETCDDNNDGFATFNTNDITSFIQQQNAVPIGSTIMLYDSQGDMINQSNPITGSFENSNPNSEMLYVQISNNRNCYAFSTIILQVNPIPELLPDESLFYCLNSSPNTITLDAGVINSNLNSYTYEWFRNGTNLNLDSSQIAINEIGTYSVTVTHPLGCTNSRTLTVDASNEATITSITIEEVSNNNSISVLVSGEGDYEYALNDGIYQDSNTFSFLTSGFYTVHVRDKNGCGIVSEETAILGFPKFFTPNGDGENDTWQPLGVSQKNAGMRVNIFDRYGKLLKEISANDTGWDGQYNGRNLISTDYWFLAILPNGKEYRGHFALVR